MTSSYVSDQGSMSIHQLVLAYATAVATNDAKAEKEIFYRIANSPIDFDGWREIFGWASLGSDVQALALTKMVELASTFSEWEAVYAIAPTGSDQRRIALEKIRQFYV